MILLMSCGGAQPMSDDAGVDNPKWRNPLEPINVLCKKWEVGSYYDVFQGKQHFYNYCVKW